MKRDMDLIRTILVKIEADPDYHGELRSISAAGLGITGHTDTEVIYHVVMLIEAGFLVGNTKMARAGAVVVSKLTWKGHELLDDIRDPEIWEKTKERAKAVAGIGLSFVWEIAKAEVKAKLGLP